MDKRQEKIIAPANSQASVRKSIIYLKEILGHEPVWADITDDNMHLLFEHLLQRYKTTTVSAFCTNFKTFLRQHEDVIPSENYRRILLLNVSTNSYRNDYLTKSEIERFYALHPEDDVEKYVRCVFLIMAYTGAQFNDVRHFDIYNANGKTKFLFYTTSRGVDVSVPLHPHVEPLLREKMTCNVEYNPPLFLEALRTLCKRAGIAGVTEEGEDRCKTIIFDTALKTFATYLYSQKVDVSDIQDVMGYRHRRSATRMIVGYNKKTKKATVRSAIESL